MSFDAVYEIAHFRRTGLHGRKASPSVYEGEQCPMPSILWINNIAPIVVATVMDAIIVTAKSQIMTESLISIHFAISVHKERSTKSTQRARTGNCCVSIELRRTGPLRVGFACLSIM